MKESIIFRSFIRFGCFKSFISRLTEGKAVAMMLKLLLDRDFGCIIAAVFLGIGKHVHDFDCPNIFLLFINIAN